MCTHPPTHTHCFQTPQVPRILNPVVLVLDELPQLAKDPAIRAYIDGAFGESPVLHCNIQLSSPLGLAPH